MISLIGFGEAASTFAGATGWGRDAIAFDINPSKSSQISAAGVICAASNKEALENTRLVLSLVTADSCSEAASESARFLPGDAIFCDMNSVAPSTKLMVAQLFDGNYVDAAILAPVDPKATKVPLLLSGPRADLAATMLSEAGFTNIEVVGPEIGQASAIKMIRSIMVKGIEALTDELVAAADAAGVRDQVLASLDASQSKDNWSDRAAYNLERMQNHGLRRAAEMDEVVKTLEELGIIPLMSRSTATRQRDAAKPKPHNSRDVAA